MKDRGDAKPTLADLMPEPSNPFILDGWDEVDPEDIPEVWWARPLTPQDRASADHRQ
jgi:hypothetical protein